MVLIQLIEISGNISWFLIESVRKKENIIHLVRCGRIMREFWDQIAKVMESLEMEVPHERIAIGRPSGYWVACPTLKR